MRRRPYYLLFLLLAVAMAFIVTGCTDESPDTSAPERVEIDRTPDWQGALLYIADSGGPVEGWGSIRIYDNVSGFVEATVEQTQAASPSDVHVTGDGSKMYVSSMANGSVDIFLWDGNGWRRGARNITTPSPSLLALEPGPDGLLYLAGTTADGDAGAIYRLDPATGEMAGEAVIVPGLAEARGITWNAQGTLAFVTGMGPEGAVLVSLVWPSGETAGTTALPVASVNQPLLAPDEASLFIACDGQLLIADAADGAVRATLQPAPDASTGYYDVAFSADGRYLFAPGNIPGQGSILYVVDLESGDTVHEVSRVSVRANGIERVE